MESLTLRQIGTVAKNTFDELYKKKSMHTDRRKTISQAIADIVIDEAYRDGLLGLNEGDYIWVIFWFDQGPAEHRTILQGHPRGDRSKPLKGVFALRSPMRPNPLGLTRVKVLECDGGCIKVKGLDAFSGTAVLDIKISFEEADILEL